MINRVLGNLGRAPVPETEEVARAAWPGRQPARLAAVAGTWFLPVLVLGTAGLVLALWLRLTWLGFALWVLVAALEWLVTPADSPVVRLLDLVGLRAPLRALLRSLPVAGLVFLAGPSGLVAGSAYLSLVLLVQLAWAVQPVLATWVSRTAPPLRYRPGAPAQPEAFAAHARVYARSVGTPLAVVLLEFTALAKTIGLASGLIAFGPGLGLAVAIAVAGLAYLSWTALAARSLRSQQAGFGAELLGELSGAEPRFLVYVSLAARQAKYIVNQWVPSLDALPEPGFLLVREASQLTQIAATGRPVVYGPSQRDVERLTLPSVRVAFYLAYGERNGQLLRDPSIKHVMLLHGDSDKATSANGLARAFDEVWVAGQMAVDRYRAAGVDLPADRFRFIGRPQAAGLPSGPTGNPVPVVLYAPTFEGYYAQTSHSSLDVLGVELVRRLLARGDVRVWFRPHPGSGVSRPSMLAAIQEITGLLTAAGDGHRMALAAELTLPDCLAAADVLVTDVSSVATEFLYTGRPIITCDPAGLGEEAFIAAYPTAACSYLVGPDLAGLDAVLAAALGTDPKQPERTALRAHVLGDPPGGPQAAFAANVARLTS